MGFIVFSWWNGPGGMDLVEWTGMDRNGPEWSALGQNGSSPDLVEWIWNVPGGMDLEWTWGITLAEKRA